MLVYVEGKPVHVGYSQWVHGDNSELWSAFFVLLLVRLFFSIIETLGSVLTWRMYGKGAMVLKNLELLHENNFHKRENAHDDLIAYLGRIEHEPEYSPELRAAARQWTAMLLAYEQVGMLLGWRMHAAGDAALKIYSSRSDAPFGTATA